MTLPHKYSVILTLVALIVLTGCRYDEDTFLKPQVSNHSLVPVAKGEFGMSQLIEDSLFEGDIDGTYTYVFNQKISSGPLGSLVKIESFSNAVAIKPSNFRIAKEGGGGTYSVTNNSSLINNQNPSAFEMGPEIGPVLIPEQKYSNSEVFSMPSQRENQVKEVVVKKGNLELNFTNYFNTKVEGVIEFPNIKNSGEVLEVPFVVGAEKGDKPGKLTKVVSLKGNTMNITYAGSEDGSFPVEYEIKINSGTQEPGFNMENDGLDFTTKFKIDDFSKIEGNLSVETFSVQESIALPLSDLFKGLRDGKITFDQVDFDLIVENTAGVKANMEVYLNTVNANTGEKVMLTGAKNLVLEGATNYPVTASEKNNLNLDENNSNIDELLSNFPDRLNSEIVITGAGSKGNLTDFLYDTSRIDANLRVSIPLRFMAESLTLRDTFPLDLGVPSEVSYIEEGALILQAFNGFPLEFALKLSLLDEFRNVIKVITTHENAVQPARLDVTGKATEKIMSEVFIPITPATFEEIRNAHYIEIEAVIDSKGNAVTLFDSYKLGFNILADLKFGY